MNLKKMVVLSAVAGASACAQAEFGSFLKKAAAITDIVTGTTNATSTVAAGYRLANAFTNTEQTASSAAKQAKEDSKKVADSTVSSAVAAVTPAVVNDLGMEGLASHLKKDSSILIVDVRTRRQFAEGHIRKAKNIPVADFGDKIGSVAPDKKTPIYVYGASEKRASSAAKILLAMGYLTVYNAGSIEDWDGELISRD